MAAADADRSAPLDATAGHVVVVIPTLNEEQSIGDVVRAIPRDVVDRIIVADGGSSDATAARARASRRRRHRRRPRLWPRLPDGAPWRPRTPTSWCSWTATAPTIRRHRRDWSSRSAPAHYDFVIGSRARGEREPGSIAWHQIAAGRLAGLGMRLLYGVRYTDMCAFRAIRRDALLALGMREMTYGWNIEMQMRAARAGLRILEIPVDYRRRSGGSSKVAGSLSGTHARRHAHRRDLRAGCDARRARVASALTIP